MKIDINEMRITLRPESKKELKELINIWRKHDLKKIGFTLHGNASSNNPTDHSIRECSFGIRIV